MLNARNKNVLSNEDYSEYLKLYDDWVAAKGKPELKKEKLKGLRDYIKKQFIENNYFNFLFFI